MDQLKKHNQSQFEIVLLAYLVSLALTWMLFQVLTNSLKVNDILFIYFVVHLVLNSQSTNPNNTNNNINDNSNSLLSSTPLEMDDNLSRLNQSNTDDDHEDNQDSNYLNDSASIKQNHSSDATISRLNAMIETLTEQLNFKTKQNSDLNNCLIKQTNLCENLSDMLKKSQQKNADLETTLEKSDMKILNLQNENGKLFS